MEKMEMELPGSTELCNQELKTIYGGGLAPAWWSLIWSAVSNFGDIREGFGDGVNGKPPRY